MGSGGRQEEVELFPGPLAVGLLLARLDVPVEEGVGVEPELGRGEGAGLGPAFLALELLPRRERRRRCRRRRRSGGSGLPGAALPGGLGGGLDAEARADVGGDPPNVRRGFSSFSREEFEYVFLFVCEFFVFRGLV